MLDSWCWKLECPVFTINRYCPLSIPRRQVNDALYWEVWASFLARTRMRRIGVGVVTIRQDSVREEATYALYPHVFGR